MTGADLVWSIVNLHVTDDAQRYIYCSYHQATTPRPITGVCVGFGREHCLRLHPLEVKVPSIPQKLSVCVITAERVAVWGIWSHFLVNLMDPPCWGCSWESASWWLCVFFITSSRCCLPRLVGVKQICHLEATGVLLWPPECPDSPGMCEYCSATSGRSVYWLHVSHL